MANPRQIGWWNVILLLAFLSIPGLLLSQSQSSKEVPLSFEVASVKPTAPDKTGSLFQFDRTGGLVARGVTLNLLICRAYDVMDFQIANGPSWRATERFDIVAKAGDDARHPDQSNQTRLQALLADRFQLKVKRETKELGIYALTVERAGHKMITAKTSESDQTKGTKMGGQMISGSGQLTGIRVTIPFLIMALSRQVERTVVDQTGLTGEYDFKLHWAADQPQAQGLVNGSNENPFPSSDQSSPSSIFVALREQLGLRLQPLKGQVPVVVIERVERPSAN